MGPIRTPSTTPRDGRGPGEASWGASGAVVREPYGTMVQRVAATTGGHATRYELLMKRGLRASMGWRTDAGR